MKKLFSNLTQQKKSNTIKKSAGHSGSDGKKTVRTNRKSSSPKVPKTAPKVGHIRKTKSIESVFLSFKAQPKDHFFGSRLTAMNGTPPGHTIFNVCAYVIMCPKHQTIAISNEEKSGHVWLPFVSLPASRAWSDSAIDGAFIVLSNGDAKTFLDLRAHPMIAEAFCLQLFRLQLPQTQIFNNRLIYYIKLNENNPKFKCCTDTKRLKWRSMDDITSSKVGKLWGPEVVEFVRQLTGPVVYQRIDEYSLDNAFTYVPRDPPRNLEEEMLKSVDFTEKDVQRLYTDFIEHCFPSFFMTQTSFSDYMSKYGFEKMDKKLEKLFRAFNFNNNSFLGFHEFLLGLTSIDPMAKNGQSRIKFLFKYFDSDLDGYLTESDFRSIIKEIYPKDSSSDVTVKVKDCMKMMGYKKEVGVHFDNFFKAVGAHKFRGTSGLCRSNLPILAQISRSMASRILKKTSDKLILGSLLNNRKYKGICESCRERKYDFAIHSVKLNSEGICVDPKSVVNDTTEESKKKPKSTTKSAGAVNSISELSVESRMRLSNEFVWNPNSVANYLIKQIRAFNKTKGSYKDKKGLFDSSTEREGFVKKLEELCSAVEKIVTQQKRCIKVNSPVFVIGDIHGNLEDLMTMDRVLWKSFPILADKLVFLGDYVDRGQWGLECAVYLMCLKLLAPNKVVLLRGNHEVRTLQKHYTYYKECVRKYGDTLGPKVFEVTNKVFDKLSFCAIIDDAIYCAHGGIPCTTRLIDKINEVKTDLKDPEKESAIAWEILWSDPIDSQKFADTAELLQVRVDSAKGFLTNNKRGTAFLFGEEAANTFLQTNGLTHIIRAHEVPAQGYTFHFGNKCTTIFSSSHYCGNNNASACVHIDSEKIRIVRLDTVNNAPASA